ncbi:hypothetical protein C8Q70DRAFT_936517 [Cubamyces menziesii]|nr:hypothetical protein C8Q70DRAFT_936517 [Cubamyces menziesii]
MAVEIISNAAPLPADASAPAAVVDKRALCAAAPTLIPLAPATVGAAEVISDLLPPSQIGGNISDDGAGEQPVQAAELAGALVSDRASDDDSATGGSDSGDDDDNGWATRGGPTGPTASQARSNVKVPKPQPGSGTTPQTQGQPAPIQPTQSNRTAQPAPTAQPKQTKAQKKK